MPTVRELINELSKLPYDREVMILDGFNGGGNPRTINLGPSKDKIRKRHALEAADCHDRVGEKIVVMGYGFY